jgi:hypothetical protein
VVANAILDKDCRIGRGVKLTNAAGVNEADGPNGSYHIRDGIICVPRGAVIPDGHRGVIGPRSERRSTLERFVTMVGISLGAGASYLLKCNALTRSQRCSS